MSYLVLARKYRPRVFDDVVGQEIATATLRGAIREGRIGHAYLFSGPRGTGKTTTARIFAKALNCERGPTPDPCGTCERCVSADSGVDVDVIEIDAASNNSVDFVRDLRGTVASAPMRARFKIFIVDEVHMLTKQAFNALLKTLEEPPPHVKFLFATTEPNKVLATVLSRCQLVKLVPLPERTIVERLAFVFEQEKIRQGSGVLDEIARRARGGMRDALSIADQLVSMAGDEPELVDLERICGDGGAAAVEALLDRIEAFDAPGVLTALAAVDVGETELCESLLDLVRSLLVVAVCGKASPILQADDPLRERWSVRAARVGIDRLQIWLEECLGARERIRLLPSHARLVLEMTLLDLCRPETSVSLSEIESRLSTLAQRLHSSPPARDAESARDAAPKPPASVGSGARELRPAPRPAGAQAPRTPNAVARTTTGAPVPEGSERATTANPLELWSRFLDALHASSMAALAEVLRARGRLVEHVGGRALVRLSNLRPDERPLVAEPRNAKAAATVFSRIAGQPTELVFDEPGPTQRAPSDVFTVQVNDMFSGRIEDDT